MNFKCYAMKNANIALKIYVKVWIGGNKAI